MASSTNMTAVTLPPPTILRIFNGRTMLQVFASLGLLLAISFGSTIGVSVDTQFRDDHRDSSSDGAGSVRLSNSGEFINILLILPTSFFWPPYTIHSKLL